MDLVSRLKHYLDSRQISVTQFADECAIPRPTGSQLLAGRNKKVSDEIISKIHSAYPDLNIVWLMFGEGSMVNSANIEISEAQNEQKNDIYVSEQPEDQGLDFSVDFNENLQAETAEKNQTSVTANTFTFATSSEQQNPTDNFDTPPTNNPVQEIENDKKDKQDSNSFTLKAGNGKRVTGIVVYYDDCTYESFIPDPNHGHPFMR
ncbi:MAG: hypothetical protein K2G41_09465 [Duncaniella sp.]|uniref:helix-turn-helix domain-containing protein n=1 Tax=Duncaniella sp. TaxID=2518496 RepID=UPI0023C3CA4C|nr:helix-turn-helix transcriptional regulator [Duncaniella sp.]MDE6090918.1 hypothetical protein [Duncaniella sp.]